jgi:hypothetical protein
VALHELFAVRVASAEKVALAVPRGSSWRSVGDFPCRRPTSACDFPPPDYADWKPEGEKAIPRAKRIIQQWRQDTFVNCWNFSDHESRALWRIYRGSADGVAIQTTFGKLRQSVGELPVYKVTYDIPGSRGQTPDLIDLVTKKRPMFAYEREARIVRHAPNELSANQETPARSAP